MLPGRLSLYIARRFAATVALIIAAAGLVIFLAEYVEVLRRFSGKDMFTPMVGLTLGAMRVPVLLDTALPFAFLFAAQLSFLGLSRTLELVVARATGVSVWGFLRAPFAIALVFGALATAFLNPLAVDIKERADEIEAELAGRPRADAGHWFRQEVQDVTSIIHAGAASGDGSSLFGLTAFVFGPDGGFRQKVTAARADYAKGHWIMRDSSIVAAGNAPTRRGTYELATELTPTELARSFIDPEAISVWSLPGFIAAAELTGAPSDRYRVAFHALLGRPVLLLAMVTIAATFSLGLTRFGGTWRLLVAGATVGFLLYAFSEIVRDLGANALIDPVLAAWLPSIIALTFGGTALLYREDG